MDYKLLGSILLIVGTSIGAGMLALPIATANAGFWGSLVLLFGCWFIMTVCAFYILEVNLWLPQNSNLISMAKMTLGPLGQGIAWLTYILLLYSLLCAYISGGSDLLQHLLTAWGLMMTPSSASILFTLIFGGIVYGGIRIVDYANRGLMLVKLGAYVLLVALLMPLVTVDHLQSGQMRGVFAPTAVMVTITSFGYATIIPSLRIYLGGDVRKLKWAIIIGSLIPFTCYLLWDLVTMGIIPLNGDHGLASLLQASNSTSELVRVLSDTASQGLITFFTKLFTSICVVTSFLGVGLCLTDFLADGLKLEKTGYSHLSIQLMTFLPPLLIVLFFTNIFVKALAYAGVYCVVLLMLLPVWMVYRGRYQQKIQRAFCVPGGKPLLFGVMAVAFVLLGMNFWF